MAFAGANVASIVVLVATGHADGSVGDVPTWLVAASTAAMWAVYLVVLRARFRADGASGLRDGAGLSVRAADAWGAPLGVASQLVLVNLVNWPLSRMFPDQFSGDKVSMRADDLVDAAGGAWFLLLFVVVVVGAPVVEEIVYRGYLQPSLASSWGPFLGVGVTAVLFAAIHFVPVEFPGLLAFALVLGWARQRTGRLGLPIVTHLAFNATGLVLVALR